MSVNDPIRPAKKRVALGHGLYKRPKDGKFEHLYSEMTPTGPKQHIKTLEAKNVKDARIEIAARETKRHSGGGIAAPDRATLAEVAADYFDSVESSLSPRTVTLYKQRWVTHIEPALGRKQVQKITPSDVSRLLKKLKDDGKSEWTRHGVLTIIGSLFEHARIRGIVNDSPTRKLAKTERPKMRNKKKVQRLDPEQLAKLLAAASEGWKPYLTTVAYTGMRASEALGLRWKDVDTAERVIRVTHQLGRDGTPTQLKTDGSVRTIRMTPELRAMLLELRVSSRFSDDSDFVFTTGTGRPRAYVHAATAFGAARKRAGLDGGEDRLSLHSLRHTAASLWLRSGINVVSVSKQLGHSKVSTTMDIYAGEIASLDTTLGDEMGNAFAVKA